MRMAAEKKDSRVPLSPAELSAFCTQIAMVLKAGIPVQEGIGIMAEDTGNKSGGPVLQELHERVEMGEPFHLALDAVGIFPKYMVNMAAIGEESGRLDQVMDSLAAYYERSESISKSIRSAVLYPAMMIGMMLVVILVLIVKVLPIFAQVFAQLGSQMSPLSQSIMGFGVALSRYSTVIVAVAAVLVVLALILRKTSFGSGISSHLFHNFFGTKSLASKISAGRFASAMSLMLSSGLDVDQSLSMAGELVDDPKVKEQILGCQISITQGSSFSDALTQSHLFSGVYARMVTVGFRTGSVDEVMGKIAGRYEDEIDTQLGGLISILEPSLVAVLSVIVGMILLSVMLPLMGIMSSIG